MVKSNKVLNKIRNGVFTLGGWVMSGSITSAEIMAQAGFDWICVDAEHSAVSKETASNMFRAIELHGAEPFVRISLNDEVEIKKYMDMGARGIIVPMIKSYEDIDAVKDIDKIFSHKEIDAVLIGPYDLSGSMGIPGQLNNEKFIEILEYIHLKAKEHSVTMGIHEVHPTVEKINTFINQGYKFIACGIDTLFILEKSREITQLITNN